MKGTNIILVAIMINVMLSIYAGVMNPSATGPTEAFAKLRIIPADTSSLSNSLKNSGNPILVFAGSAVSPFEQGFNTLALLGTFASMYMGMIIPNSELWVTYNTGAEQAMSTLISLFIVFINFSMLKELWLLIKGARD